MIASSFIDDASWYKLANDLHVEEISWQISECTDRRQTRMCSKLCPGWLVDNGGESARIVQRCDDCKRFEHDDGACRHVVRELRRLGRLSAAPCGSLTCEFCFIKINDTNFDLDFDNRARRMSKTNRSVHNTLFALWDAERRRLNA